MAAPWTHDDKNEMKDPINLKFRTSDLPAIEQVLRNDGWGDPLSLLGRTIAEDQYLHISNSKQQQDSQLCKPPNKITRRYHIRLWVGAGEIVASAHVDVFTPFAGHATVSFERGEKEAADAFTQTAGWKVESDGEDLRNFLQKPPNNGFATIITKGGP